MPRTTRESQENAPIAAELFSADQMERYGEKLAQSHKLSSKKAPYYLLKRLAANETLLTRNCHILSTGEKNSIAPAGEWLLDNFYLIEEQIRLVRQLLPKNFGKGLPALAAPHNCPRIYDIATEAIAHSDGHWDPATLTRFIAAYQKVTPLKLGELWALPGMLRLALIENLRRVSIDVAKAQQERNLADRWVNKMQDSAENDPARLIIVIADMARSNPPRTSAFVAELVRRLQGHGSMLALPLTWIEQRLAEAGLTTAELIARFNQHLAVSQLSVSNSITGLRQLNEMNWADFAESMSLVEKILHQDPSGVYPTMHFDTRDHYRHVIEMLARHSPYDEAGVARQVIALTENAPPGSRMQHVGYFLVDKGRKALETHLKVRFSPLSHFRYQLNKAPLLSWLGSLSLLITAITADLLFRTHHHGMNGVLWLLAIPVVIVCSQFVMNLLSEITTRTRTPHPLPRLDFSEEIPQEFSTLVAVPCLLGSRKGIDSLLNGLEVCYLGNARAHLYFALVADFHDSSTQFRPADDLLLEYASAQISQLNRKYPDGGGCLFTLLHRENQLNTAQGVWMGYERKRGKLGALNRWLRGEAQQFTTVVGASQNQLSAVKYVITLDSDTVLPRATAHQLISAMAHPLNHPIYDPALRRVVEGYAILQPRLAEEIPRYGQGRYAAMSSSIPGNDPYSSMSSDIYQDLFGEGSFVGKGIYDIDMFMQATANTCPENLVLSHDLLEGCYARSGMLSDVVLYEQYPANYLVDVSRRSRWIRGDWQLFNWLRLRVRQTDGSRAANPLSTLSRWKLLDNLRRSLVAPCLLVMIFTALALAPNPGYWLAFIATLILLPTAIALVLDLLNKGPRRPLLQHIRSVIAGTLSRLSHIVLYLATLPHESGYTLKAILVTLWRLAVSHKHLQEWASFDASKSRFSLASGNFYRAMWVNPVAGVALILLTMHFNPMLMTIAMPLGALWCLAPRLLSWLSQSPVRPKTNINVRQRRFLRQTGRETWSFFATFVNQQESWLPPDNYQEVPEPVVAHRTSPTNIGLSLLANMTALDFGYITQGELLLRTTQTLDTLDKLEHFRGHLYNWYDTRSLAPLNPRYISSVDSGNLAGHLLTLSTGFSGMRDQPAMNIATVLAGLEDTLYLVESGAGTARRETLKPLRQHWVNAGSLPLHLVFGELNAMLTLTSTLLHESTGEHRWLSALQLQLSEFCQEWALLFGWMQQEPAGKVLPSLVWLSRLEGKVPGLNRAKIALTVTLARKRLVLISELEQRLAEHARMDFKFLYNSTTNLLSVGYNCDVAKLDSGSYDLLPSEIRLTNYFTIATNQLPQKRVLSH